MHFIKILSKKTGMKTFNGKHSKYHESYKLFPLNDLSNANLFNA